MPYTPILGSLGYVVSADSEEVLLVHRNAREDDPHLGKYNGLGGKMEPGEDIVTCMQRELYEEAHITATEMALRGTINWTGFGPNGEDWLGFIFLISEFEGEPLRSNEEGTLDWHPVATMMELPKWEGDRYFLPLVFDGDPRCFHGFMPYEGEKPISWNFTRI